MEKDEVIKYLDFLSNGIDPLTEKKFESDNIFNRSDIVRWLLTVKHNYFKSGNGMKRAFELTVDEVMDEKLKPTLTDFVRYINDANQKDNMRRISRKAIFFWLISEGYIESKENGEYDTTPKGLENGFYYIVISTMKGPYNVLHVKQEAQKIILNALKENRIKTVNL